VRWGVRRESLNPTAGLCWPRRSATFNVPPHMPAFRRARDAAREYAGVRCVSTQPALERLVFSVSRSLALFPHYPSLTDTRDIFLQQPCLLELEAPLKICGACHAQR
jgi:hypothetical protein